MTGFDYAVLAVLALSALLGFWRGVVSEVLGLAAWVAAFFAAGWWGGAAGETLARLIAGPLGEPMWRQVCGYVAVFVATLLAFGLARLLFSRLLRAVGLGLADRLMGLVFGAVRGGLLVLVMVAIGGMSPAPRQPWWSQAWLARPLETAVLAARPWLPEAAAQRIGYR